MEETGRESGRPQPSPTMPHASRPFTFLSADHIVALVAIAALCIVLPWRARRRPGAPWVRRFPLGLALVLLGNQLVWHGYAVFHGGWRLDKHLPLQLCDGATIAAILALLWPAQLLFEACYFWGFGGALQALLTPDLNDGFPHFYYCTWFVTHGGLVLAPAFLAFGQGRRLQRGAVPRAMLYSNAFMLLAGLGAVITGGNYMFLREPPPRGSLVDSFGPWPWYIATGEVVAFVLFLLLALPCRAPPVARAPRSD